MNEDYISQLKQILATEALSQQELAKRLGVSFAALNRWLNKHAIPHKKRIEQIGRLHRDVVGYSSLTAKDISRIITEANNYKKRSIWTIIGNNQNLQDYLVLEHTYNSTTIEGTTFTKKETEAVIFDKVSIKDKSLVEHLDVVNYSTVLRKIFKREFPQQITEGTIKEIHRLLMHGVREDGGEYSKYPRGIRGVDIMLPHPKDIPEEMGRLILQWNSKKQKNLHAIAKFHSDFELIHPFGDGNGRVGRLIMVLQCQKQNYAPVIIENARKAEYYEVLEFSQRKNENPLVQFLVEEMRRTYRIINRYM
ncbi:MAG: Fic family protein [Candidatus Omnitrophica bacterium]|nr:Fic family protein [Candidatus Omnitrophota bacterium]